MNWQIADRAALLARSGQDPFVAHNLAPKTTGLIGAAGWAALQIMDAERAGAVVILDHQPDAVLAVELWRRLQELAAAHDRRLTWLSTEEQLCWPLDESWLKQSHWVWMSTTEVNGEPDPRWQLSALDDSADAAEINAFALPINPLFEGDPGKGLNRCWLAARDTSGQLIGCGTVHDTAAGVGHLAGLVVAPEYRGQGLGRALLLGLSRAVLADDGVTTLSAYADNQAAIALYRSVGYRLDHAFHSRFLEPRR